MVPIAASLTSVKGKETKQVRDKVHQLSLSATGATTATNRFFLSSMLKHA
jgi:hypothetical protein